MKIQILGTGCPKCKKLAANAEEALKRTGVQAEIEKVTSLAEISKFGVVFTPALAIDGEVKSSGRIPSPDEIAQWIQAAQS
jgi:small redox-active disulfide protein 2